MSLSDLQLKKILESWSDSEDDFHEDDNEDDSDYELRIERVERPQKSINKRSTVKINNNKSKKHCPKTKTRAKITIKKSALKSRKGKAMKKKKKKKKVEDNFWYSGYSKSFVKDDLQFKGNANLSDTILGLETSYDFFKYFFTDDVSNLIIEESNRYNAQKWPEKQRKLSKTELNQYIGICTMMSVIQMPNLRRYWAPITGNDLIKETMPFNKFEQIKQQLHFNNNEKMVPRDDVNHDRIFKIRPLVSALTDRFRTVPLEECLSVDEQICSTKCRSIIKVYMPNKPYKWGFKVHVLAGSKSGFCYFFEIYTGHENDDCFRLRNEKDLGASANIVIRLIRNVPNFQNYKICFDNYFSTLPLLVELSKRGIQSLGTMRRNRLRNKKLPKDKDIMSLARGSSLEMVTKIDDVEIASVTWRDTKVVSLISNFVGANPMQSVERFDKKLKKKVVVDCPNIVKEYNSNMGGVDLLDSMIGRGKIKIRSKKWYMRIYYHLLDITITNAWILYKKVNFHRGVEKKRMMTLGDFRIELSVTLCKLNRVSRNVGRPPTEVSRKIDLKRKRPNCCPIPPKAARLDKMDHWPQWFGKRLQCKMPECKGYTFIKCSKCRISLCCNKQRNCFHQFHTC